MIRVFCIVAFFMLAPVSARACMPIPDGAKKPAADVTAKKIIEDSQGTFVGKVEVLKYEKMENKPPVVTFKVLEQFSGKLITEVAVPVRGDNCSEYKPVVGDVDFVTPLMVINDVASSEWVKINFGTNDEMEKAFNKYTQMGSAQ